MNIDDGELVWREHRSDDNEIATDIWLGEVPVGGSVAYAFCYVSADAEQSDLQLRVTSNESKVYLNGTEVYKTLFGDSAFTADRNAVKVRLNRGLNTLLFKGVSTMGGVRASIRLSDRDGKPVKGIKVTLTPESFEAKR